VDARYSFSPDLQSHRLDTLYDPDSHAARVAGKTHHDRIGVELSIAQNMQPQVNPHEVQAWRQAIDSIPVHQVAFHADSLQQRVAAAKLTRAGGTRYQQAADGSIVRCGSQPLLKAHQGVKRAPGERQAPLALKVAANDGGRSAG
jgi:hypothetical protein